MTGIVVPEYLALVGCCPNAIDDRGVVHGVARHQTVWNLAQQALQGRIVRAEAGWKDQRGLLVMPLGKAGFQAGIQLMGSADIARAAGAGAVGLECDVHLLAHRRVLGHSQVVVAAPDNDRLPVAAVELG